MRRNQPKRVKSSTRNEKIINQKIEKKPTKIKKEKKEEREKFEINLQIQPFDFEISCSKYQNSATVKHVSLFFKTFLLRLIHDFVDF